MAESGSGSGGEVRHRLGPYEVAVATTFGPRVTSLRSESSPEMFASLGRDLGTDHPSGPTFRFRGGHRLWVSPEDPAVTYAPDDHECTLASGDHGLTISAPKDGAGFEKAMRLSWADSRLTVEHRLRWVGEGGTEVSPWAITQVPLGGVAILPVAGVGHGLGADRSVVVWPYTLLDDERLSWTGNTALIHAMPRQPTKLGAGPATRSVGYLKDGHLFTKRFDAPAGDYPDRGALAQVYTNDLFCELESLGPLVKLEPGEEANHVEVWEIERCPDVESAVAMVTG